MTKLGLFCERLLEAGWLVAVATVPLYFDILSNRVFEPDKLTMLRGLVVIMALAQLVKWLEGARGQGAAAGGGGSSDGPDAAGQERLVRWRLWPENPLALPTLILVATYVIGTVVSVTPGVSIWGSYQRMQGTYSMLAYVVLFFIMAVNLRRRAQIERLFSVILLVSLPISIYGIVQHLHRDPLPWGGDVIARVTSSMGNAIFLAAYLIMVIPITLYRAIGAVDALSRMGSARGNRASDGLAQALGLAVLVVVETAVLAFFLRQSAMKPGIWWAALPVIGAFTALSLLFTVRRRTWTTVFAEAVAYVLLLVLQLTATVLTLSRGPWLGLMAGFGCFAVVLAIRRRAWQLLSASSAVGVIAIAFLVVFNIPNSPLAPLREVPYVGRLGQLLETQSGTGRVRTLIWQGTLRLLAERPPIGLAASDPLGPARLLLGYGPESMYVAYNKVYPPDLAHYEARNASPDRNHNDTLDYLVNVGILGLLAYLFLVATAFYLLWRHLWRAPDLAAQLPIVALLSALVAHLVEAQTGIVIAATHTYFWVYLAVIVAAGLFYRRGAAAGRDGAEREAELATADAPAATVGAGVSHAKRRRMRRPVTWAAVGDAGRSPNGGAKGGDGRARAAALALSQPGGAPYLALSYAVVVAFSVLLLAVWPSFQDIELPLYLSFFGLLVGVAVIAWSLGRWPAMPFWRGRNWWAYGLIAVLAILIVGQALNVVSADIYYKRGFSYDGAGAFDQSIVSYNQALRLAPDQDFYYLFLGRAYLELAKRSTRAKASPAFEPTPEKLLAVTPDQLGSLGREDLLNASRVSLETARLLNPLNTDHYANLGRLYRIWGEMGDRSKFDLADEYYREATTLSPQAAHLYDEWAQVEMDKGDAASAVAKTKIAVDLDPIFPMNFIVQGDAYQMAGQNAEALEAHGKALALDPAALSDGRFEQRLAAYEKAGLLGQIEQMYAKATKDQPTSTAAHSAYGYVLTRQNKMREALAEFQTNVSLSPTDWVAYRNLALVYQSLGMIDPAIASAQTAQRYAPADQASSLQNLVTELQKKKQ